MSSSSGAPKILDLSAGPLKQSQAFIKHDPPMLLGEGALFRPSDNTLHYLDIEREPVTALYVAQLTPSGELVGAPREVEIKGSRHVTALAFRKGVPGSYICTTNTGLAYLSEKTGELEHLSNGLGQIIPESEKENVRFNDATCDSKGRFYFHSMPRDDSKKEGKLYLYEKGMKSVNELKVLETGFAIGNGPVIDEEKKVLYLNFTEQGLGWTYDWDAETGAISNRRLHFDNNKRRPQSLTDPLSVALGPGFPDGHTLDSRGNLYQAVFARGMVERFTPDGVNDFTIHLNARCPTCPVFGGENLDQLYVTTASQELKPGEKQLIGDLGGEILRIDLSEILGKEGSKGIVKHEFDG